MPHSHSEPHLGKSTAKLNSLRAAVLGSNDGIVSVASIVVGVAGATNVTNDILTAGIAGLLAGAFSMAAGEFVSVSSQRDAEKAMLDQERKELDSEPDSELDELIGIYEKKGLTHRTASLVAKELTQHDAFSAHADAELNIDPNDLNNPWQAAISSATAFTIGALIPLIAILVAPKKYRIIATFSAVVLALIFTGYLSGRFSKTKKLYSMLRVVVGGVVAMLVTYSIGLLIGQHT